MSETRCQLIVTVRPGLSVGESARQCLDAWLLARDKTATIMPHENVENLPAYLVETTETAAAVLRNIASRPVFICDVRLAESVTSS